MPRLTVLGERKINLYYICGAPAPDRFSRAGAALRRLLVCSRFEAAFGPLQTPAPSQRVHTCQVTFGENGLRINQSTHKTSAPLSGMPLATDHRPQASLPPSQTPSTIKSPPATPGQRRRRRRCNPQDEGAMGTTGAPRKEAPSRK